MRIFECNHKVTRNSYEAVDSCETIESRNWCESRRLASASALVKYSTSVLSNSGWHFVGSYLADFTNLSGHHSTKPHHHVKVADHGGGGQSVTQSIKIFDKQLTDCNWVHTGWAKKVSYCTLSISSLNIDKFSQFFHQWTLEEICYSVTCTWHLSVTTLPFKI